MIFRFGQKHCRLDDVVVDMLLLYTSASGGSCSRGSYVGHYYRSVRGKKQTFHVEELVTGIERRLSMWST